MERIVSAQVVRPYVLELTFTGGRRGRVDLEQELYGPVFEPLRDPVRFAEVSVDHELGTVVWPNGADFSPEFLVEASLALAGDQAGSEPERK